MRHLTSTEQIDRAWIEDVLIPACDAYRLDNSHANSLRGKAIYCLFYEPSFVTRTSFERAAGMLGADALHTEDASQFFPVTTANYIDNVIDMLASLHIDLVALRSSDPGVVETAAAADAIPVVNAGSAVDHPTQALTDVYTLHRELGRLDGLRVAAVGRLEHRNVNALLVALSLFDDVCVDLLPFSGRIDPAVESHCRERGLTLTLLDSPDALSEADAIYLNGPRTVAHAQLLKSRNAFNIRIDSEFMSTLKPGCPVLDPMQRSGDFDVSVDDDRLAFYRQAENSLYVRMAVLSQMMGGPGG